MTVVVAWGLRVVHLQVLGSLLLVNLEVEVGLALDLAVDVLGETLLLLTLELLLEVEGVQLLPDKASNAVLDLLDVLVVPIVDLADLSEYPFLLLGAAQLREPFCFSGFLVLLLAEVCLREHLKLFPLLLVETAQICGLRCLGCLGRVHEGLD